MQSVASFYFRRAVQEEMRAATAITEASRERHARLARTFREKLSTSGRTALVEEAALTA
mgnify:CR=1 FL=1